MSDSLISTFIKANGTAIKGGCATRREHRAHPGSLAAKRSRCQEGMARVFAVQAGFSWGIRVSWHKLQDGCEIVMLFQYFLRSKAQCRGRSCLGARNLSWLQNFYCKQCANPGSAPIPDLSWVQNALRKNRDKQLTFIDRVSCCIILLLLI
jgi:hypothetical protein